jgi:tRNA modification GTPase
MIETDTIAAPATPRGKSALAALRISGPAAFQITARCIQEKILFEKTPARYIQLFIAKDPITEKTIDQITAVKYSSPRSFTGEDMVEFFCHGGPFIVNEIHHALITAGARLAKKGEFTRRALLNRKIDLMKAEAIRGLIECNSEAEFLCAQKLYYSGNFASKIRNMREGLIEQLAKIENFIEFEEEQGGIKARQDDKEGIVSILKQIEADLTKREKIKTIEKGLRIVIAGPTNAGKSTLFNTIVGYNRAIVHSKPGTTRDTISETVLIKGHEVLLIDSAGIRDGTDDIEREGVVRSKEEIEKAHILIWVTAADRPFEEEELKELMNFKHKNTIYLINKIDKSEGKEKHFYLDTKKIKAIGISLKNHINNEQLMDEIGKRVEQINKDIEVPDLLLNARYDEIGRSLYNEIKLTIEHWDRAEVAANYLKSGITKIDEWLGKTNTEDIINKIFDGFCIGK